MVVGDLDLARGAVVPLEAKAVLAVDGDTLLADAIPSEGLDMVAGRDSQFVERGGGVEQAEFDGGSVLDLDGKFVTFSLP